MRCWFDVGTLVAPLEDIGTHSATSDGLSSAFNELLRKVEDSDALDELHSQGKFRRSVSSVLVENVDYSDAVDWFLRVVSSCLVSAFWWICVR